MDQVTNTVPELDWLGLRHLARVLHEESRPSGDGQITEVVDRLQRTLELVGLVEEHSRMLRKHARHASPHEVMQLAGDLRRLANRVEAVGAFVLELGNDVIELEEQILEEFDERIRRQSEPSRVIATSRWAAVHAA